MKSSSDVMNMSGQDGASVLSDIRPLIHEIRGVQVMLDRDLAAIYHVMTGRSNEAVKRNIRRFPSERIQQAAADELSL